MNIGQFVVGVICLAIVIAITLYLAWVNSGDYSNTPDEVKRILHISDELVVWREKTRKFCIFCFWLDIVVILSWLIPLPTEWMTILQLMGIFLTLVNFIVQLYIFYQARMIARGK